LIALVTGASSGIGAALARALAARGDTVGIIGRREEKLAAVLADCQATSPNSRSWVLDLADLEAAERWAIEAWDALGPIDVFVNNAATPKRRAAQRLTTREVETVMAINYFAPARMTLALLPRMLERSSGAIVNVASLAGRAGLSHEAAYSASKFAMSGWSEVLAMDLDGTGIKVRLIQPGPIAADSWDRPDNDPAPYNGPLEPPELVADAILAALESDRFEHYVPDLSSVIEYKTSHVDEWIAGQVAMRRDYEASQD
jgi:short-subunit dehydrogenase